MQWPAHPGGRSRQAGAGKCSGRIQRRCQAGQAPQQLAPLFLRQADPLLPRQLLPILLIIFPAARQPGRPGRRGRPSTQAGASAGGVVACPFSLLQLRQGQVPAGCLQRCRSHLMLTKKRPLKLLMLALRLQHTQAARHHSSAQAACRRRVQPARAEHGTGPSPVMQAGRARLLLPAAPPAAPSAHSLVGQLHLIASVVPLQSGIQVGSALPAQQEQRQGAERAAGRRRCGGERLPASQRTAGGVRKQHARQATSVPA